MALLLSDEAQAAAMTTRARQLRAAQERQEREAKAERAERERADRAAGLGGGQERGPRAGAKSGGGDAAGSAQRGGHEGDMIQLACNAVDESNCAPLHLATIQGDVRNVVRLIERGASPIKRGVNGMTPLMCAAAAGHLDAVTAILDRVPATECLSRNQVGQNAGSLAESHGHEEVFKLLRRWVAVRVG